MSFISDFVRWFLEESGTAKLCVSVAGSFVKCKTMESIVIAISSTPPAGDTPSLNSVKLNAGNAIGSLSGSKVSFGRYGQSKIKNKKSLFHEKYFDVR